MLKVIFYSCFYKLGINNNYLYKDRKIIKTK